MQDDSGQAVSGETSTGTAAAASGIDAAAVAHDFRNLLTAIGHGLELIRSGRGAIDFSDADFDSLASMVTRGQRLATELMRITSGGKPPSPSPLDVDEALKSLLPALRGLLGPGIDLVLEAGGGGRQVAIDPCQFDRALINLAANAGTAMAGSGRLTLRTCVTGNESGHESGDGTERDRHPPSEWLRIEVRDTGPGIVEVERNRLFQERISTKPAAGGLGLSIVRAIVEAAGGTVTAESTPGQGACFILAFPLATAIADRRKSADAAIAPEVAVAPRSRATVLVVDDEDPIRLFVARALTSAGYRVIEARSGEEALARFAGSRVGIDVIVSDLMLPGIDGNTLLREVRRRSPRTAVVAISGYGADGPAGSQAMLPSVRFLAKPFTLSQLVAACGEALAAPTPPMVVGLQA